MRKRKLSLLIAGLLVSAPLMAADADRWNLPIETRKLDNGLTVVVSEDHSSPTVGISVIYHVGMRLEPKNRTGFAHLFEHLMFEGTPNAPEGVFDKVITGGGGRNNGSTRADFTNYIEIAPTSALESMLWLEADRMKTLDFNARDAEEPAGRGEGGDPRQRQEPALRRLHVDRHRPARLPEVGEQPRRLRQLQGPRERQPGRRARLPPRLLRPQQRRAVHCRRRHPGAGLRAGAEVFRRHPRARHAQGRRFLRRPQHR